MVRVDGGPGRASLRLRPGAQVTLEVPPPVPLALTPEPMALAIVYEDEALLVVDKPAGLLTLPTTERERDTLLDRAGRYLSIRYGERPYVGIVLIILYCLAPFYWMIVSSLRRPADQFQTTLIPNPISFQNYIDVFVTQIHDANK